MTRQQDCEQSRAPREFSSSGTASLTASAAPVSWIATVLCIGAIKRARYRREEQLAAAAAELDALESRRRELERLLGTD